MTHETVHPVEGKSPSPRSLYSPKGLIVVIRNSLKRHRAMAKGAAASDFDILLQCLDDLEQALEGKI